MFIVSGQLTALDQLRTGQGFSTTRNYASETFAKMISESKANEFIEKMSAKDISIYGDTAVITDQYTFQIEEKSSHCETNAFHLLKGTALGKALTRPQSVNLGIVKNRSISRQKTKTQYRRLINFSN